MIERLPFTLADLRAAYAGGLRPTTVVGEVYRRVAAAGDPGIFLHLVEREHAIREAEALGNHDPRRPLWGIPFAIKDNIDLDGAPTTAACPAFAYAAERDAFVVARLRAAGALPIGKTNLDQFAAGLVGVRTPYPAPRNALDPAIVPGGSSSGSAVAVARGLVGFALGTDTAGSGRVPAALNNIVGLKPTLGALSSRGVVPACRTLDTISIFAMTVEDAHLVLRAATGFDAEDPYARLVEVGHLGAPLPHPSIGVPSRETIRFFGDGVQARAFDDACIGLEAAGARIVEVDFSPFYEVAVLLYDGPWVAERFTVIADLVERDPEAILPVTRSIIGAASGISAGDAFRGFYRLEALRRKVAPLIAGVDLFCVPSIPTFYSVDDLARDPVGPNSRLGTYTNFVNLLGLCALTVPTAPRADGRPGSVTLLAPAGRDALIAAIGRGIERRGNRRLGATDWPVPPPGNLPPSTGSEEMEIAVCGAHMSGLPLNGELTRLGARFLRSVRTISAYRLFSLPGGAPHRPGLVRCEPGTGAAIRVEVWALPRAQVGTFIAGIPAPLCIGTVLLADGTAPKGFLCEPAGTAGARDVSAFGDWRHVVAEAVA